MTATPSTAAPGEPIDRPYDRMTIFFHWLTAALVLALFGSALLKGFLPRDLHYGKPLEAFHISIGILFAVVVIGRMVWRLARGRRLPQVGSSSVVDLLLQTVHAMLYLLVGLQVVLGFALRWLQGEDFSFFGLFTVPSLIASNRAMAHTFEDLHNFVGWTIVYVAGAHAVAALWHHFMLRDRILGRMLPALGN